MGNSTVQIRRSVSIDEYRVPNTALIDGVNPVTQYENGTVSPK